MDLVTYCLSKAIAVGAVSGIDSISVNGLTLEFECHDGTHLEMTFPEPEDGVSVTAVEINSSNHLICTMSNGNTIDAGYVPNLPKGGQKGQALVKKSNADGDVEWGDVASGGGGELSKEIDAVIAVGGITSGTKYSVGTPIENILSDMLEPTLYPTFTAPSASLSYSEDTYYAVGATIAAKSATVSYNAGAITLNGTKQNNRGGAATGYSLATVGADTENSSSGASGSFSVPPLTRSTKGTIKITGTVSYAQGAQPKDSKGNDYQSPLPAGSVSSSKTLNFIQPYYYGKSASSTISDFTGLTADVSAKGNKTYNYTTNNEYMIIAYDSSYGNLNTILDGNGFDVTGGWTKSTLTVGGFSYFVYIANSPTTDTNAPFTFKY